MSTNNRGIKRRFLTGILCVILVISCFSVAAFAESEDVLLQEEKTVEAVLVSSNGSDLLLKAGESALFEAVLEDGEYNVELFYESTVVTAEKYSVSFCVDGQLPFEDCADITLPTFWEDDGASRELPNGDEIAPAQKQKSGTVSVRFSDSSGIVVEPYRFAFSTGKHTFEIKNLGQEFRVKKLCLVSPEVILPYEQVSKPYSSIEKYDGEPIIVECENSLYRTSSSLSPKSDRSSADVSPSDPVNSVVNYIGGESWVNVGDTIVWEFEVPKDGLYQTGFSFKQSYVINGEVFRQMKIDGKTPFSEATNIGFPYKGGWQFKDLVSENGDPLLIYLTKGKHEISLTVTLAQTSDFLRRLGSVVEDLGNLYLDILMITGETPDANRDYELHKQIPDFVEILQKSEKELKALESEIANGLAINGEVEGSIRNMIRIIGQMTGSLYEAHLQVQSFCSAQQTLSAWLYDMRKMPLSIDRIFFSSPEDTVASLKASFFEKLVFECRRFVAAFSRDYSTSTLKGQNVPMIKLWVNWGRDQVKVLSNLIYSDFSPNHNVNVVIEQVNTTLVQGIISGNSPDIYLHMSRSEPVNLAMRGVLYDLKGFDDFDRVISDNFKPGAETPYLYKDGCYALPDMQQFNVMFYREDIFNKLNLSVPKTWEEYISVVAFLQRNKMNAYLPYTKIAAAGTVSVGAGGLTIFPTLLMQMGGSIYNKTKDATLLASDTSVKAFTFWTDFYTRYSQNAQANFYNKFRQGVMPLGISNYTLCFTLKAGAPELDGKWKIAPIPGIQTEDGTVNNVCAGSGSGCVLMKSSKEKKAAWEFLKWWVSANTQYHYSLELEAILGETARVSTANVEAVSRLSWEPEMLEVILSQWDQVKEIEEVPGSYYVSRSIDQAFWATLNKKSSAKEAIEEWAEVSDIEIERKIKQYS